MATEWRVVYKRRFTDKQTPAEFIEQNPEWKGAEAVQIYDYCLGLDGASDVRIEKREVSPWDEVDVDELRAKVKM